MRPAASNSMVTLAALCTMALNLPTSSEAISHRRRSVRSRRQSTMPLTAGLSRRLAPMTSTSLQPSAARTRSSIGGPHRLALDARQRHRGDLLVVGVEEAEAVDPRHAGAVHPEQPFGGFVGPDQPGRGRRSRRRRPGARQPRRGGLAIRSPGLHRLARPPALARVFPRRSRPGSRRSVPPASVAPARRRLVVAPRLGPGRPGSRRRRAPGRQGRAQHAMESGPRPGTPSSGLLLGPWCGAIATEVVRPVRRRCCRLGRGLCRPG